jgi:beta-glucosidase
MSCMNTQEICEKIADLLSQMTLAEKVAMLSGTDSWHTHPVERLGIPAITMTDGPHGVRSSYPETGRVAGPTTSFPTGVSMAATWDPTLIEAVGEALAEETLGMDCDILLGPCVNIVRHPLAGRNFEAYSEDPYLAGKIGSAWVKGLQRKGVGASLKHFACNNQEVERMRGSSQVDERTMREIYLPNFEMVVKEAEPYTVMCAYNRINGVYASQNNHLLREILKDEWQFEGLVMSDWGANHTTTESVQNGLDLEMPGPAHYYGALLEEGVRNWQIDESMLDEAVGRILTVLARLGRLDASAARPAGAVNTTAHQALAAEVAEEAITLLKNEGSLLPLDPGALRAIAVIGPNAAEDRIGGGGSSFVDPPYRVSPLAALKSALGGHVEVRYARGCDNWQEPPILGQDALLPLTEAGQCVMAEFFDNPTLSGQPVDCIYVPKMAFWMRSTSLPVRHVTSPRFSIRISAQLLVAESGAYVLHLTNSGLCHLYLDGKHIHEHRSPISGAIRPTPGSSEVTVQLEAGKTHTLKVEFLKDDDDEFTRINLAMARHFEPGQDPRMAQAAQLAAACDVAIVFAGMPEGFESEGYDRPDMRLPGAQDELIQAVLAANPRTVVVLNAGSPVEMPWADRTPAILEAYYPGQEGGNAVAHILLGQVNPSGKLTVTFPRRLADTPAYLNYPGQRIVLYGEGIFVGYRYYDQKDVAPLFPFGHGLSYTQFRYSDLHVTQTQGTARAEVSLKVTNVGQRAGKEVIQLYVGDSASSLPRPPKELKGFAKVALEAGASTHVTFQLDQRAFAFYDPIRSDWVVEPGEFMLWVGSSSRDIRAAAHMTVSAVD